MKLRIELFSDDKTNVPFYGYDCLSMAHPSSAIQMGVEMLDMYDSAIKVIIRDTDVDGWLKEVITKANKDKYFKYMLTYDAHAITTENGLNERVLTYPRVERFKSLDMLYSRKNDLEGAGRISFEVKKYDNFVISKIGK